MLLVVTTATRDRLDPLWGEEIAEPSVESLATKASGDVWLTGGEPTLRADLPELIAAFSGNVGLVTDGLPLTEDRALAPLCDAGLTGVRLRLHAARAEAHDWLVGMRGAARRAVRAARRCRERGLALQIEARVTRPTLSGLHELVALAHELGAGNVHLHPVVVSEDAIARVARHALLAPHLDRAAELARRLGVSLALHDFPRCMVGQLEVAGEPHDDAVRCRSCDDACVGFHPDYVARFGREEVGAVVADGAAEIVFGDEPTRELKKRLVRMRMDGARVLRVVGASLSHPEAAALLRETTLLDFERVEVMGVAHGLAALSDADLYPLSGIDRLDGVFFGADAATHDAQVGETGAFDAACRGLRRFAAITGRDVGALLDGEPAPEILDG